MRRFFILLWRLGRRDLRLLWYALQHPQRPAWLLPASLLLLAFAIEPFNFALPPLGLADDLVILPLALHTLLRFLPPGIAAAFDARAGRSADARRRTHA
jgi:uncharacterized membrane protein YkvA (DUF1232 family)